MNEVNELNANSIEIKLFQHRDVSYEALQYGNHTARWLQADVQQTNESGEKSEDEMVTEIARKLTEDELTYLVAYVRNYDECLRHGSR